MEIFLAALVALVALNGWATRLVLAAPGGLGIPKGMLIAGIWLIPIAGAFSAKGQIPVEGRPPQAPRRGTEGPAPEALAGRGTGPFVIADHLTVVDNVPVLDWRALHEWAQAQHPGDAQAAAQAIDEGRRAWLLQLRDVLGPHAHLHATADAYILSTLDDRVLRATAKYISTARQRISRVLGDLARFPPGERSILVVLDSEEDYYRYVSIYYPDSGEFSFSGGMHIDAGCPHFVLVRADLSAAEPVIAHELTHSALAYLRLPRWLDEGLAVNTEYKVAGAKRLLQTPHELHEMHLRFWNPDRIQGFWSGASFDRTDDGNLLSYELARILVEQMAGQWEGFAEFVRTARREDAGATAAQAALSIDLGSHAAALLEVPASDAWSPRPAAW